MGWFERLTGFRETSPAQVRERLTIAGDKLTSRVNGRSWTYGKLTTPSLSELRRAVGKLDGDRGRLTVREAIADVGELHADPANAGATFQVASQFNLLEMVDLEVTPEAGVGIYDGDPTQGPRCAIAAGAGTIYRNYFAPVNGQVGQSAENQIDCLADLGAALGNADGRLWAMRNGYAIASREGLREISSRLAAASAAELDGLRERLRVGVQHHTQVTIGAAEHCVTQVYGSALPVAYSDCGAAEGERFARLVLEASYEATLLAAMLNAAETGNRRVFLTLLGGGVFGNELGWILDAVGRACDRGWGLDVVVVSYRRSRPEVRALVERYRG
ncbi:MAG: hypothetical protein ACFB9N_18970 [Geitlerinemataceae cyanobacterium]|mgnify:CR=1 FL=1